VGKVGAGVSGWVGEKSALKDDGLGDGDEWASGSARLPSCGWCAGGAVGVRAGWAGG
jgi:hypothetical protein